MSPRSQGSRPPTARSRIRLLAIDATGGFSLSQQTLFNLLVPLWAIHLKAGAVEIGLVVGIASLLPFLAAVPAGGLTDRLGPRKVLLASAIGSSLISFLYPLVPRVAWLVAIQSMGGLLQMTCWVAAQTYAANASQEGDMHRAMGRFGFATNLGSAAGPVAAGWVAQRYGLAHAFVLCGAWSGVLALAAWLLPPQAGTRAGLGSAAPPDGSLRRAVRLCAIPGVGLVLSFTVLRVAVLAIRSSFYPVLLHAFGLSALAIGILFSVLSVSSTVSPLFSGWLTRRMAAPRLLQLVLFGGAVGMALTPVGRNFGLLVALAAFTGLNLGLTLPLLMSFLALSVTREERGLAISLRQAANRLASSGVPVLMGLAAAGFGITAAFYGSGAVLIGAVITVALRLRATLRAVNASG